MMVCFRSHWGSMVEFLKSVYERAQSVDKFDLRRQPKVVHTRNTSMASTNWDMRLSVACAATDAEFQNRLMVRDQTLNLPVMERQPHPTPTGGRTQRNSSELDPASPPKRALVRYGHGQW